VLSEVERLLTPQQFQFAAAHEVCIKVQSVLLPPDGLTGA
jgi:hypothetical protein